MPVPANVIRANVRATVGTNEEMVHTFHFKRVNTSVTGEPSLQEIADKIRDEWIAAGHHVPTVGNPLFSYISNTVTYRTVDVYALDSAGHATNQAQSLFTVNNVGTSAALSLPPEVCIVASLRTGFPGRSKRGRLYLGGFVSSTLVVGGLVQSNVQNAIAQALEKFGEAMKFAVPVGTDRLNWVVLSRTLTEANKVTEVRVGNVYDVQRRRQSAIAETYVSATVNY